MTTGTTKTATAGDWQPEFSPWRHGGWYVDNLQYPSGAVGCVSCNYPDRKWRIACDPRPFAEQPTFPTRIAAAFGERELIASMAANGDSNTATQQPPAPDAGLREGEHNPLPWYVKDSKGVMLGSSGNKGAIFICDRSAGTWVAELPAGKESEANAALIVRAVNAHAALVQALAAAEEHLEYCGYGDTWERECATASRLPEIISEALRQARGGE
jgi:hypothetical protein